MSGANHEEGGQPFSATLHRSNGRTPSYRVTGDGWLLASPARTTRSPSVALAYSWDLYARVAYPSRRARLFAV